MQKVQVLLTMRGDYAAFHEISFSEQYDLTNDVSLDGEINSKEEAEAKGEEESNGHSDSEILEAILFEGNYYYKL